MTILHSTKKGQASPVPPYYSKVIELKPEGDGQIAPHVYLSALDFPCAPTRHLANYSHGFTIERLVARASLYLNLAQLSVDAHYETAQYSTLNVLTISVIGVFAGLVNEVYHATLATRELGLDVDQFIIIHNDIVPALVR